MLCCDSGSKAAFNTLLHLHRIKFSRIDIQYFLRTITDVAGRGGTSFFPHLERVFLRKIHADVMIFFTDGFGLTPAKKPQIPVLFVLTEGVECPATWGKVIYMGEKSILES